jgi:hypothetical protein
MPFVNMQDLLIHAREHGYAVAALDEVSLDFLEGVIRTAENCRAPVIVSLAKFHFEHYICSWPPRRRLAAALARRSPSISTGIPRRAATRRALTEGARYHYCWLIRFCSAPVIDAYLNHPDSSSE